MIFMEFDLGDINSFEYESTRIADPHYTLLAYRKGKQYVIVICLKGATPEDVIKGMPNGHGCPVHAVVCENLLHFSDTWHSLGIARCLFNYGDSDEGPLKKPTNIVEFRPAGQLSCPTSTDRSA